MELLTYLMIEQYQALSSLTLRLLVQDGPKSCGHHEPQPSLTYLLEVFKAVDNLIKAAIVANSSSFSEHAHWSAVKVLTVSIKGETAATLTQVGTARYAYI